MTTQPGRLRCEMHRVTFHSEITNKRRDAVLRLEQRERFGARTRDHADDEHTRIIKAPTKGAGHQDILLQQVSPDFDDDAGSRSEVPALGYPLKQRVSSSTRRGMLEIADCIANVGPYNGNCETGAVKTYCIGLNRSLSEEIT